MVHVSKDCPGRRRNGNRSKCSSSCLSAYRPAGIAEASGDLLAFDRNESKDIAQRAEKTSNGQIQAAGMVVAAILLPMSGSAAKFVSHLSAAAIGLPFFLYCAKPRMKAIVAGIANGKLQFLVVATTFVLSSA